MAMLKESTFGKLISIDSTNEEHERFADYIGLEGLILIWESQKKDPGKAFVHFYPYEDDMMQRYLITSLGELVNDGKTIIVHTKHSTYVFDLEQVSLDEEKRNELLVNVLLG